MEALKGKKTYIVAALAAMVTLAKYLDYIDEDTYQAIIGFLGAGGIATLASKGNRIDNKLTMFLCISVLGLSSFSSLAYAQAVPTSKLAWDQTAPDLATAQGYTYKYYPDSSATGTVLTSVTCAGTTSPFQCEVNYPAFTPGNHTLKLTASNVAGEGLQSDPFAFTFIVTPGKPTNIHIK